MFKFSECLCVNQGSTIYLNLVTTRIESYNYYRDLLRCSCHKLNIKEIKPKWACQAKITCNCCV